MNVPHEERGQMKMRTVRDERGFVLVLALLMLVVLTLMGMTTVNTATFDNRISGNKRVSEKTFDVAEAGISEFLGRFREGVTGQIADTAPTNPQWRLFIASDGETAAKIGYSSSNPNHTFAQSLQNSLTFGIEIKHKVNIANAVVTRTGSPLYLATSRGFTMEGGNRTIEAEFVKSPSLDPPAALYSERPVDVLGSATYIQGMDQCGNAHKPGILTPLSESSNPVNTSGHPDIQGAPGIVYGGQNLELREMVDYLKKTPGPKYDYTSNKMLTGESDSWGTPVSVDTITPISYSGPINVVYFNMHGDKTLKLAGGCHGAGILLVEGNLELNGAFNWYGIVIVTGALDYTGGGQKNITGGVMTGETATVEVDVGGNAGIMYCSDVANKLKQFVKPVRMARWRDVF
jgi:hypothetical protein